MSPEFKLQSTLKNAIFEKFFLVDAHGRLADYAEFHPDPSSGSGYAMMISQSVRTNVLYSQFVTMHKHYHINNHK